MSFSSWGLLSGLVLITALSGCAGAAGRQAFDNLDLGVPGACDQIVHREGYALGYSERYEQALWVSYRLTKDEVMSRKASRQEAFYPDPEIRTGSATLEDYRGSGYDRGHLAPAGDMHSSEKLMLESFSMANMSPQVADFNRGIWSKLEQAVRRFAYSEGSVFVVTGPVFDAAARPKTIGANKVRVPEAFYKVVYDETPPSKMIAFIIPNRGSDRDILEYVVSVDEVEKATGLDFFSRLPEEVQAALESKSDASLWSFRAP